MAYLSFIEAAAGASPAFHPAGEPKTKDDRRASLSPLEWSVVALAANDTIGSLRQPGRLAMALGAVFGERTNPRLADPRLEALRRMAVLTWHHGYEVAQEEVADFLSAGFDMDEYDLLVRSITVERAKRRTRKAVR